MEGNDDNSDKITIRVCITDDDYHDIIIDRSKEMTDVEESIFQQLSSFTKIPFEKINLITFWKPDYSEPVHPHAPGVYPTTRALNLRSPNFNYYNQPDSIATGSRYRLRTRRVNDIIILNRERRHIFFRDGDRFALNSMLQLTFLLDETFVNFILVHQDIINDSECSHAFCHHSCSRFLLDKQCEIINSNIDSYLREQARFNPGDDRPYFITPEYLQSMEIREKEILKDLNIAQYFYNYCSVCYHPRFRSRNHFKPRVYWPYRG